MERQRCTRCHGEPSSTVNLGYGANSQCWLDVWLGNSNLVIYNVYPCTTARPFTGLHSLPVVDTNPMYRIVGDDDTCMANKDLYQTGSHLARGADFPLLDPCGEFTRSRVCWSVRRKHKSELLGSQTLSLGGKS